jgi:hypothetical protein
MANDMAIRLEKLKARLLANPRVKAEYDALAPEFEIAAELPAVEQRRSTHPTRRIGPRVRRDDD